MKRTSIITTVVIAAIVAVTFGSPTFADDTETSVPYPDVRSCLLGDGSTIPEGQFVVYDSSLDERATGSHVMTGMPCGPIIADSSNPSAMRSLPATGAATWIMSAVASVLIAAGAAFSAAARRRPAA